MEPKNLSEIGRLTRGACADRPHSSTGVLEGAMMKVVVAEDEVLVRLMLADVLREHGFEVFEAANVAEALSILRAMQVDVVITDLNMQIVGDGMLVAGYARRHGRCTLLVLAS